MAYRGDTANHILPKNQLTASALQGDMVRNQVVLGIVMEM